jgi:diaminopimelate epimerase
MIIKFSKLTGSGNDFIVIDNRKEIVCLSRKNKVVPFIKNLCDRKWGIGSDGVLVLGKSLSSDFYMRIFNADGSEAEMCGNGARCAVLFAYKKGFAGSRTVFETLAGRISGWVKGKTIKIQLSTPNSFRKDIHLPVDEKVYNVCFINTGVPHTIVDVEDIENLDVKDLGKKIRFHKYFSPSGTNVNFVRVFDKKNIQVRTYERGVEDETLACGTGVVASSIVMAMLNRVSSPVNVVTRGKEILRVYFKKINSAVKNVFLEGRVRWVFDGEINI